MDKALTILYNNSVVQKFVIHGPNKLEGEVNVSGSKNAALQLIPATLLANSPSTITNVPDILDIKNLLDIIKMLGVKIDFKNNELTIDPTTLKSCELPEKLVGKLRASIMLAAPLVNKFNSCQIPYPGGCVIGKRPLNYHFDAYRALGYKVTEEESSYRIEKGNLAGTTININFSVLATGNAIMAAVYAKGETIIKLAACEPEVSILIEFLNGMGADIKWIDNHVVRVKGVTSLHGANIKNIPDRIEAGTFAIAAAACHSEIIINDFYQYHNDALLFKFKEANVKYEIEENNLHIKKGTFLKPVKIQTKEYPGFPTDLQAPFSIIMTQAEGISEVFETIFEGRLGYLHELEKMGAKVIIKNSQFANIEGPTPLYGTHIESLDLRAGATLIIAALTAQGESTIDNIDIIDRGYEGIEKKLVNLGANISRVTSTRHL